MARTTAELQEEVQRLTLEVEAFLLAAGVDFPAEHLLHRLEDLAARLSAYRSEAVPPDALEMEIALRSVTARLERERAYLRWMQSRPVLRMATYQLLWLVTLGLMLLVYWQRGGSRLPAGVQILLGCMLWGAVGAIFSSLVALIRHRADRTLLPDYEPWHYMKPLVGGFTGALVYLILAGGVQFFNPPAAGQQGVLNLLATESGSFRLAFLLAAISGFQERAFFTKLDALIKTLLGTGTAAPPVCCCCAQTPSDPGTSGPQGGSTCPVCGASLSANQAARGRRTRKGRSQPPPPPFSSS